MAKTRQYTQAEINDAKRLVGTLMSLPEGKRSIFSLMIEAMIVGAELGETTRAAM